jgi:urea transporter
MQTCFPVTHKVTIQIAIATQTKTISLPLLTLPFGLDHYIINMPHPITHLDIQGIISKQLTFE